MDFQHIHLEAQRRHPWLYWGIGGTILLVPLVLVAALEFSGHRGGFLFLIPVFLHPYLKYLATH